MENKLLGRWGEELAAKYLTKKKYKVLAMGYSTRFGEIDIIAEDKKYVAFVEVKLRRDDKFAEAREFVHKYKQQRIFNAAQCWLVDNESDKQPRFDVIEIYAPEGDKTKKPTINHIEDAFQEGI